METIPLHLQIPHLFLQNNYRLHSLFTEKRMCPHMGPIKSLKVWGSRERY
jgi:hypothetical protein